VRSEEEYYAYQQQYSLPRLMSLAKGAGPTERVYVIHPAFRRALRL
jgi:hypothetical protein